MKKVIIIVGAPRSGTTFCADTIKSRFDGARLYDELNPVRLLKFNFEYYYHLLGRSRLERTTSKNENTDRFSKIKDEFKTHDLSFSRILNEYFFPAEVTIIKYPRLLEDMSIYPFLSKMIDANFKVIILKVTRDYDQTLDSIKARNMYFARWPVFHWLASKIVTFYDELNLENIVSIEEAPTLKLDSLKSLSQDDVNKLEETFRSFPFWIARIHYALVLYRNYLGRRFW